MMVSIQSQVNEIHELTRLDSVTSTVLHPMGSVAATCSGQRHSDDKVNVDNSLKVWSMPFLEANTEE